MPFPIERPLVNSLPYATSITTELWAAGSLSHHTRMTRPWIMTFRRPNFLSFRMPADHRLILEDMSLSSHLQFGPLGPNAIHLCVDMQTLFAERTDWHVPWL
jgi:hypothetical protein